MGTYHFRGELVRRADFDERPDQMNLYFGDQLLHELPLYGCSGYDAEFLQQILGNTFIRYTTGRFADGFRSVEDPELRKALNLFRDEEKGPVDPKNRKTKVNFLENSGLGLDLIVEN